MKNVYPRLETWKKPMQVLQRHALIVTTLTISLLRCTNADAYWISVIDTGQPMGTNLTVASSSSSIYLADFFDQYADTGWEISSVRQAADGRVHVTYNYPNPMEWDSYNSSAYIEFRVIPEAGDLKQEVSVDVWGATSYRFDIAGACCFSDAPLVRFFGNRQFEGRYQSPEESFVAFNDSFVLDTNTSYFVSYRNTQYVEGDPDFGLPHEFASWAQYEAFVARRGSGGLTYVEAEGFMNFNLALTPTSVPEPGSLALLGAGVAGMALVRRRRSTEQANDGRHKA